MSKTVMQPALNLVENHHSLNSQKPQSIECLPEKLENGQNNPELLADSVITLIWRQMTAIYGHKWFSLLGAADDGKGNLTFSAKTWQKYLAGISVDQVRAAFKEIESSLSEWPPSVLEFKAMCLFGNLSGIPSLDEVVSTLTFVRGSVGSIAARYKHPLTFAIAQSPMVDMCAVRTGKSADIKRMLKPVYEKLIASGWNGWPEHAHDSQKRIVRPMHTCGRAVAVNDVFH